MAQDEVKVRFRFKDQDKVYRAVMTMAQFDNFRILPAISLCEKVSNLGKKVNKETEQELEKKLADVFKNDTSHVKNLCYD